MLQVRVVNCRITYVLSGTDRIIERVEGHRLIAAKPQSTKTMKAFNGGEINMQELT